MPWKADAVVSEKKSDSHFSDLFASGPHSFRPALHKQITAELRERGFANGDFVNLTVTVDMSRRIARSFARPVHTLIVGESIVTAVL
ncbi:hypothetical protein [Microbacterium sp. CFBP 8794]|uniref:hypothetical protein n=1 Tax=Microbacterium sp. CFBP 8794 TaxID=2775269 RepID=UPI00177C908E|nr:hypothetical protein [Microbacterium sp. CFBP 8794]MBD8478948.1 hypothetical protein [Microbacterium sp. CFBP 8794]